jgi:hypothetical protein
MFDYLLSIHLNLLNDNYFVGLLLNYLLLYLIIRVMLAGDGVMFWWYSLWEVRMML